MKAKTQKMKKSDIKKFKERLTEKKAKVIERLMKDSSRYHEIFKNSTEGDLADIANDSYEKYLLYDLSLTEKKELKDIETALEKIDDGTYGQCETCKTCIPLQRLEIMPEARFCVKCKEKAENGR